VIFFLLLWDYSSSLERVVTLLAKSADFFHGTRRDITVSAVTRRLRYRFRFNPSSQSPPSPPTRSNKQTQAHKQQCQSKQPFLCFCSIDLPQAALGEKLAPS